MRSGQGAAGARMHVSYACVRMQDPHPPPPPPPPPPRRLPRLSMLRRLERRRAPPATPSYAPPNCAPHQEASAHLPCSSSNALSAGVDSRPTRSASFSSLVFRLRAYFLSTWKMEDGYTLGAPHHTTPVPLRAERFHPTLLFTHKPRRSRPQCSHLRVAVHLVLVLLQPRHHFVHAVHQRLRVLALLR